MRNNLNYNEWRSWVNKTYGGLPLFRVFIKLLDAWNDDHKALEANLEKAKACLQRIKEDEDVWYADVHGVWASDTLAELEVTNE